MGRTVLLAVKATPPFAVRLLGGGPAGLLFCTTTMVIINATIIVEAKTPSLRKSLVLFSFFSCCWRIVWAFSRASCCFSALVGFLFGFDVSFTCSPIRYFFTLLKVYKENIVILQICEVFENIFVNL